MLLLSILELWQAFMHAWAPAILMMMWHTGHTCMFENTKGHPAICKTHISDV